MSSLIPYCGTTQSKIIPPLLIESEHPDFLQHFQINWINSPNVTQINNTSIQYNVIKAESKKPIEIEVHALFDKNPFDVTKIDVREWSVRTEMFVGDENQSLDKWTRVDNEKIISNSILTKEMLTERELRIRFQLIVEYDREHCAKKGYRRSYQNNPNIRLRLKPVIVMKGTRDFDSPPKISTWSNPFSMYSKTEMLQNVLKHEQKKEQPPSPLVSEICDAVDENLEKGEKKEKLRKRKIEQPDSTITLQNQIKELHTKLLEANKKVEALQSQTAKTTEDLSKQKNSTVTPENPMSKIVEMQKHMETLLAQQTTEDPKQKFACVFSVFQMK